MFIALQNRQPGMQHELKVQPETTRLPSAQGRGDVLTLKEYEGANKLLDKIVVVTGGDSGIGRSVCVFAAREGAAGVVVAYHPSEKKDAEETGRMVEAEGADCYLLEADLRKGESVCKDLIQRTVDRYGSIDVLINNASEQHTTQKVEDLDSSVLESTFAVNVFAMLYLAKHAVPHMKRGAAIVNSASVVAYAGGGSLLEYTSSKGAIVSLTRALSQQLAPRGIRVNAVAPGPIMTPLNPATRDQENLDNWYKRTPPLGRIGQDSSYMTGQVLHPNGGTVVNT
ncbi:hypothetical protein H632_c96p1 [Helicosporidium sp. ATCC 50920]|nr:hypothetical protein H632_c96p1 [Helicosporidium sp. ATCC 50920]|eukprot:KDD76816.1 hypothetical protein H632_c96p1 [Helicosporidium sp. ATCC 50920]